MSKLSVSMVSKDEKKDKRIKVQKSLKELKILMRVGFAILFMILGYNLSKSTFFEDYPIFSWRALFTFLLSSAFGFVGFFLVPFLLINIKLWIERTINNTVTNIVTEFWNLQSKKIQEARREKQKKKSEEEKAQKKEEEEKLEKEKNARKKAVLLDTSVLVDGRILDIVKTGFLSRNLLVIQPVVSELQLIADSKDKIKRQRGRRGLDILKDLKKTTTVIIYDVPTSKKKVDDILVEYAEKEEIPLMTMDFNLNKVAQVSGVKALNLNNLVNALKTVILPGEEFHIKIIQKGKEKKQGVGYLDDGTMVVVEDCMDKIDQEVRAEVKKVIQSSAGKMLFCSPVND